MGLALGFLQANLVVLPHALIGDFLRFCALNPKACPVIGATEPGSPHVPFAADAADLRTDLPRYRVYRDGLLVDEPLDVNRYWRSDSVGILLGCSLSFEHALVTEGIPLRHLTAGRGVSSYLTNVECEPAGPFSGPLVTSMRPIPRALVERATEITSRFELSHGAPIHIGPPEDLGIDDLSAVIAGDPPIFQEGDVPVFWAGGSTTQRVALSARPEYLITHAPGHMFVSDLPGDASHTDIAARARRSEP